MTDLQVVRECEKKIAELKGIIYKIQVSCCHKFKEVHYKKPFPSIASRCKVCGYVETFYAKPPYD